MSLVNNILPRFLRAVASPAPFLTVLLLLAAGNQPLPTAAYNRRLAALATYDPSSEPAPSSAAEYLDGLFADHVKAAAKLTGTFTKRSKIAVVYMCYERSEIIHSTLTSLLLSEGRDQFDLIVSQDGGSNFVITDEGLEFVNSLYIRHPVNLCTGLHHYFVKRFAFDIMGYDALIVVEEDNVLHPQALQMLRGMLDLAADDKEIGLVSITDMDNSLLLDEEHYSSAALRAEVSQGHLWVYAIHNTRYQAVRQHLTEYYNTIKGNDYRKKDVPPLRDSITKLITDKGFPSSMPLSQDAFFVHSLEKEGYTRRLTTMVRLFEPMGWEGLHFRQDPTSFYSLYGKGMYEGSITGQPYEVTKNPKELALLQQDCRERLDRVYQQYLGRNADDRAAQAAITRLVTGKLNAVELVRNVVNSAEHRRRMKEFVSRSSRLRAV